MQAQDSADLDPRRPRHGDGRALMRQYWLPADAMSS
jgi:hypothetical protein